MIFTFLHIGDDKRAEMLVRSIRHFVPRSQIIQCSNSKDFAVPGIDQLYLHNGDTSNLMTFRLEAFANLRLNTPAVYLDTDILITQNFQIDDLISEYDLGVCRRSFNNDNSFNINFRGINLSEYKGKSLGEVYPFLASFTISRSFHFWEDCRDHLQKIDQKFHFWYGDQEAIREILGEGNYLFKELPEAIVSCLPEYLDVNRRPIAIHFKGEARKNLMLDFFKSLFTDQKFVQSTYLL